ncbi:pantoate--beta-alanine ligase [Magnolia sinica]|uniref:pantoate--beta-alanine ligase n=1 Tax=Magnolia sinica TaxID=86752 RepID=UPI00265AB10F|nr:pantoate--beta-alanine ligase [Magnolia sinica]
MAKEPEIIRDKDLMRSWSRTKRSQGKTLALVPTMGYLHQGHLSLIQEAQNLANITVVSIYVNPGQFSPSEDLATYPSDFHGDIQKLREAGVDAVFHPQNLYDYGCGGQTASGSFGNSGVVDGEERKVGSFETAEENPSGSFGNSGFVDGEERKVGSFETSEENPSESFGNLGFVDGGERKVGPSGRDGEDSSGNFGNLDADDRKDRKVVSCVEEKGGARSGHETWIRVERLERGLCGKSRPVFFRGVATVVAKLFNIVEPDVAVFGKKDYQQWRLIRRMVRDLDFGINVIGSEIVRETDGLAMSSRNVHLLPEEREKALSINKSLSKAKFAAQNGHTSCRELRNSVIQAIVAAGGKIDYAEIVDQESLEAVEEIRSPVVFCVAACFGKVRLIDNMEIYI